MVVVKFIRPDAEITVKQVRPGVYPDHPYKGFNIQQRYTAGHPDSFLATEIDNAELCFWASSLENLYDEIETYLFEKGLDGYEAVIGYKGYQVEHHPVTNKCRGYCVDEFRDHIYADTIDEVCTLIDEAEKEYRRTQEREMIASMTPRQLTRLRRAEAEYEPDDN